MGLLGHRRNTIERLNTIRLNSAVLGTVRPIFFGQHRLAGRLIWYGDFTVNKAKQQGGKGLSKGGTTYVYTASIIAALCEGPASALLNLWDSTGRFVLLSASETHTIAGGGGTFTPANAAIFGNDQGVAVQQAFSVGPFTDYGSPGPVTLTGTQNVPMVAVPSSPATGQYSVDPVTGIYTFAAADAGKVVVVNYSFFRYQIITQEITIIPFTGPFTVTVNNSTNFKTDQGVAFTPSGTALAKVGSPTSSGQYSQSGATYTFNSADAGQAIVINYIYNDPNTNNNAPSVLNLTLVGGTLGQAALSYMTGRHPTQALGYSQLAYIFSSGLFLGFTPELPNYSYELAGPAQFSGGILDANPADCITQLLTSTQYGLGFPAAFLGSLTLAKQCWSANNFFISPLLENPRSCSSIVAEWLEAGMVAGFWSEALLKFVPYGDTTAVANGVTFSPSTTPVANLTYDDIIVEKTSEPITLERSPWQDAWNKVRVSYSARINDYNSEVIEESDEAGIQRFGLRVEDAKSWDFITTLAAAQYAASMRVQRSAYIRNKYTFRASARLSWLEPMDVVTIPLLDLSSTIPVRIIKVEDDPVKGLAITAEDFIWGTAQPAYNPKSINTPYLAELGQQDPGSVNPPIIFEANQRTTQGLGYQIWMGIAGQNPNWGGCHVWISRDNANFKAVQALHPHETAQDSPARIGVATTNFPFHSDPEGQSTLNFPATAADVAVTGGTAWTNPNNAKVDDGVVATSSTGGSAIATNLLQLTNFGFTIDSTDTILGILVEVKAGQTHTGLITVHPNAQVRLLKAGVLTGNTNSTDFGGGLNYLPLGGNGDLWGAAWTPADVNASNFGISFQGLGVGGHPYSWSVDAVRVSLFLASGTVTVDLSESKGVLTSGTAADADNLATLCLIDNELISYQTATVVGNNLFVLGGRIRRGQLGTSIADHVTNAPFMRIDEAIFRVPLDPLYVGQTLYFKFTSFNLLGNQEESLQNVPSYSFSPSGQQNLIGATAPANVLSYSTKTNASGFGLISFTWSTFNITRTDGSLIIVPASSALPVPATPTLSQVAGGALGARTRFVRTALMRDGMICGISAEASLAVSANNLLKVTAPNAVAGYDGWLPMVGTATNGEFPSAGGMVQFGTDFTEPSTGFVMAGSQYSDDPNGQHAIRAMGLATSTAYFFYPDYNLNLAEIEFPGGANTAVSATAAIGQNAQGNVPMSAGPLAGSSGISTPAVSGTGSGTSGGGAGGGTGGTGGRFLN